MQAANHATAVLSHVLAPAPSKTPVASVAHYAASGWTHGGVVLGLVILVVVMFLWRLIPSGPRIGSRREY